MICTDKDLGLIILHTSIDDNLKYYIDNDLYTVGLAKDSEYNTYDLFSDEHFIFFNEHFKFVKFVKCEKPKNGRHSNKFDLYYETNEESLLYWSLKYRIIS